MLKNYLFIGCGGALGAMTRVFLANILPAYICGLPVYILLINVFGCFLIGILSKLILSIHMYSHNLRLFFISGFLGAFTTFSAFALEYWFLIDKNKYFLALIYTVLSIVFSLSAFWLGSKLIKL